MNATMTKAFNGIKSTLSTAGAFGLGVGSRAGSAMGGTKLGGWTKNAGTQMGSTIGAGYGAWKGGAGAWNATKQVGAGLGAQWKHGDRAARTGMASAAGLGAAGVAGAADFLNPWGLGWGD